MRITGMMKLVEINYHKKNACQVISFKVGPYEGVGELAFHLGLWWICGGFHKWGILKLDGAKRTNIWMIWGYPYFRTPRYPAKKDGLETKRHPRGCLHAKVQGDTR